MLILLSLSLLARSRLKSFNDAPGGGLGIIIQVCIYIYMCVSERMIDLMCTLCLCVCVFVHVKIMYVRVCGWLTAQWPLLHPHRVIRSLPVGNCTILHPKQAV